MGIAAVSKDTGRMSTHDSMSESQKGYADAHNQAVESGRAQETDTGHVIGPDGQVWGRPNEYGGMTTTAAGWRASTQGLSGTDIFNVKAITSPGHPGYSAYKRASLGAQQPQFSALEQMRSRYYEPGDEFMGEEAFMDALKQRLDLNVRYGELSTPERALHLGALAQIGREEGGYGIDQATAMLNQRMSRGAMGSLRDRLADVFGEGYDRTMSREEMAKRSEEGTVGIAAEGLERGLYHTGEGGDLQADEFGQAWEALDSIAGPFGLAGAFATIPAVSGGVLTKMVGAAGRQMAMSPLSAVSPKLSTLSRAYNLDPLGAAATLNPIGEVARDQAQIEQYNKALGLERSVDTEAMPSAFTQTGEGRTTLASIAKEQQSNTDRRESEPFYATGLFGNIPYSGNLATFYKLFV